MLLKKGVMVAVLLAVIVCICTASASAASAKKTMADDLVVVPLSSVKASSSASSVGTFSAAATAAAMSTYSIKQGQTNWHNKYIGSGCPGYVADLNWGNGANSLRLRIYCADGSVKGPYYDNADGVVDGRIALYVYGANGYLPVGTFYHEVYGYRVTGTEDYTF
jgi:hypothetical protein